MRTQAPPREPVNAQPLDAFACAGEVTRGRPWCEAGATGRVYGTLAPELAARVPRWLATLAVPEGTVLKAPDVHRVGGLVVKFFTRASLFGWLRPPRAVRSAERYFWCLPLRSPRPLVAAGRGRRSVLVREHVAGELLSAAWRGETCRRAGQAEEALAAFLAGMQRHGVVHGDLHPQNLLWTGTEWVLLDVDGLRHGLHDPARVLAGQWARFVLFLGDEERVRALHRRTSALAGQHAAVPWERVRRRVEILSAQRAESGA